jgi:hypothetical protein
MENVPKVSVSGLLGRLREDTWRKDHPFSEDVVIAQQVLLHPYSYDDEKQEALGLWLQKHQPCVFGRVAAKQNKIYYCFLTEADLHGTDSEIRNKIQRAKRQWKQWSLDGSTARHSFMLAVTSVRVALAAPDENLKTLAVHLRGLFTTEFGEDLEANDLGFQSVFLRNPSENVFYKFSVIMDFFAAAGDGRWWCDHRVPGGLAFTFNSLGHMVRTKEWYGGEPNPTEWALKLAMATIANADEHPKYGRATWLQNLDQGRPLKAQHGCPFSGKSPLPAALQNKDWTTYAGLHHSDHSVREEFFSEKEHPLNMNQPFLIDFSYIYAREKQEDSDLMDGILVSAEEVYADIGNPDEWRRAAPLQRSRAVERPDEKVREINEALMLCRRWEIREIDGI